MLSSPPPSSKDVFFLPLSQTSWEGYTALCVRRHSLFIFLLLFSLSRSLIHGAQRTREKVRRSLSPGQGEPREDSATKVHREGGMTRKETQKRGRCFRVLCSFLLVAV